MSVVTPLLLSTFNLSYVQQLGLVWLGLEAFYFLSSSELNLKVKFFHEELSQWKMEAEIKSRGITDQGCLEFL